MDYKNTLNISQTAFEMKANLNKKEQAFQKKWLDTKLYSKIINEFKNREMKILHDGPPYANGNLHVGHALNKILKDMIVRTWLLYGYNSFYIPGWDTHGLPIEYTVSQKTNNYNQLSIKEKREKCLKYAKDQIEIQKSQFKRFGLITDFVNCYYTFDHSYEIDQLKTFAVMVKKNLIYQDFKPVYWSWSSKSALADAEIEYHDVKTVSVYVSFNVINFSNFKIPSNCTVKLLIWTTTPWTIPANQAICVNEKFDYVLVRVENNIFVIALTLLKNIAQNLNWKNYEILYKCKGKDLENIKYIHPMYQERINRVILGDYVQDTDGSGLVHCAPGFGIDDYYVCRKNNICDVIVHIDDFGKIINDFEDQQLRGLFYLDANQLICDRLKMTNNLHGLKEIIHSEPHDWRTKKSVIYRATKQWFIDLKFIHDDLKKAIDNVKYQENFYRNRMYDMVLNRGEWCISRQRVWGVPIPIIFDDKNKPIFDEKLITNIIKKIDENGIISWFEQPVDFFLTQEYLDKKIQYKKEQDIMDVWFDSGSSFNILKHYGLNNQADLYLEGSDQYRGWFNSSMICSTIVNGIAPYKELFSHGITLDENGHKMSKSLGNVVDPIKICDVYGADILRLWVCSIDYTEDNKIGDNIIKQVAEQYRKIRNTLFRFPLANIKDFDFQDFYQYKYSLSDLMIIAKINKNLINIDNFLKNHMFHESLKLINKQIIDLSSWYFDLIKDSLYCDKTSDHNRRAIQSVLNYLLYNYLLRLSIILPHTCEEVYEHYNLPNKKESVFFAKLKSLCKVDNEDKLIEIYDYFMSIKDKIYAEIEILRQNKIINKINEVDVRISNDFISKQYKEILVYLKKWLNVASVSIISNNDKDLIVTKSNYNRCERCWTHYSQDMFYNEELCIRCNEVIKQ